MFSDHCKYAYIFRNNIIYLKILHQQCISQNLSCLKSRVDLIKARSLHSWLSLDSMLEKS